MTDKFDANAYKGEYLKNEYDRLNLTVKKGEREKIKAVADKEGQSINEFCLDAIYEKAKLPKPEAKTRGRKPKIKE